MARWTMTYEGKISEIEGVLEVKADRSEIPSLSGYATESWVEAKGYLTEHQPLDDYYTKEETDTKLDDKLDKDKFETKMGEVDTALAGKVDHNEFTQRCESIEQSIPTNTEIWTFELEDGSTITKEIYVK